MSLGTGLSQWKVGAPGLISPSVRLGGRGSDSAVWKGSGSWEVMKLLLLPARSWGCSQLAVQTLCLAGRQIEEREKIVFREPWHVHCVSFVTTLRGRNVSIVSLLHLRKLS